MSAAPLRPYWLLRYASCLLRWNIFAGEEWRHVPNIGSNLKATT